MDREPKQELRLRRRRPSAPAPPTSTFAIPSLPSSTCAAVGGAADPDPDLPARRRSLRARAAGAGGAGRDQRGRDRPSAPTSTSPRPARSAGCSSCRRPGTTYGVDANGDGVKDPYNPEDAIFAAASYLQRRRHAHRHLRRDLRLQPRRLVRHRGPRQRRLLRGRSRRRPAFSPGLLAPQLQVLELRPGPAWRKQIPADYLSAFEDAAARYELGKRGVWALAAIARLESNFGRGMTAQAAAPRRAARARTERVAALRRRRRRRRPHPPRRPGRLGGDAGAADLVARQPQRRHLRPQPGRVVRAGGARRGRPDRRRLQGLATSTGRSRRCAAGLETAGPGAVLNGSLASAPSSAPAAVKAAIAAANSISTTPYVWGGGHGSWYSYGYDCSGAVSFALYGAGLLDTPAHLRRAGELRRTRAGPLDHDLRQRHPHLRGDRRAALGHGRRRPGHRAALARWSRPTPKASSCGTRSGTDVASGHGRSRTT